MYKSKEQIFDDDQLALIKEQQTEQLISELVECIVNLRGMAAQLREEVNGLSHKLNPQAPPVYYEIHADLCKSFEDSPSYPRFEKQLVRLIYD